MNGMQVPHTSAVFLLQPLTYRLIDVLAKVWKQLVFFV